MKRQSRVTARRSRPTAADAPPNDARPKEGVINALAKGLLDGGLPDEIEGFDLRQARHAALFVAAAARQRSRGTPVVRLESEAGRTVGTRRMRLCVINDDMPFLVDSIAAAVNARGLLIHRLLHPIFCVERDTDGQLQDIHPPCEELQHRESFLYLEIDRAPATVRRTLGIEIAQVLADVRAAVEDWPELREALHADAEQLANEEGAALLHWFADGAMTLLGHQIERPGKAPSDSIGVLRHSKKVLMDPGDCAAAIDHFERGGPAPLLAKADHRSTVHRRVPLDLIVLPIRTTGKISGLAVHAGLWTSQALRAPPDEVPVLRRRLSALEESNGFDPRSHAGKALRHAMGSLPHDLLIGLDAEQVAQLVATAMSLADRPRPTVELLQSVLKGQLFAFVWLPREELSTRRRLAIGTMLEEASTGHISSWTVELGEDDLALLRFTIDGDRSAPLPDNRALNSWLDAMLRGWEPAVEEALTPMVGGARAARLALSFVRALPEDYRTRTDAAEAAEDVVRLSAQRGDTGRGVRLLRRPDDGPGRLRLKVYRGEGTIALSDVVPVFENFGFQVLEELPTALETGARIHEFLLATEAEPDALLARAALIEPAIAEVLAGAAENDAFNQLLVAAALDQKAIVLLRAWFRYLRQTGLTYGLGTVVTALRRSPAVAQNLVALFRALHDPTQRGRRHRATEAASAAVDQGLAQVTAIDEDRILRLIRDLILACLRTNAFLSSGAEALAFKFDSSQVPGLPAPVPWREIWVYSPRAEGIHLRNGPIARGGIRWSDRRDDFRTEILGLMKAQIVKNAVIVPTGAKGGFYPKQLPPAAQRDAWLAEGTEAYGLFIRALLSLTDNLVDGKAAHPDGMIIRDGDDPYFVVAADKGTARFSDIANALALERGFWLGDAFASGGGNGYDHKAMGITARGAWIAVRRHFAELGVDVQSQPVRVVGVGDMSGDVFGNGMLLSQAIKLVAAFDHRHIFLDPDPDPTKSWEERRRLFALPRSSWDDYDRALISKGGGVFPRTQKSIPLSAEMRVLLAVEDDALDPAALIRALLKAPADLLWFGGIGTYVKSSAQSHADVGDPANEALRVDAEELGARVIGEGANLAVTQAGRVAFAAGGGRINTDFIDNSAGVDCSDHEVNIKIPLNREMAEGGLTFEGRNRLLAQMTDEVAELVLEDNRLQTLALSIAERGGIAALPALVRGIEILEERGRLNRRTEGLASNEDLLRRAQDNRSLTRPELAVLLSSAKLALQSAIEASTLPDDPMLGGQLLAAFPAKMRKRFAKAIAQHPLRREILATRIANRFVNRLGILAPFALTEEQGGSFAQAASAFVAAERLFAMDALWSDIEQANCPEEARLALFEHAGAGLQLHVGDIMRATDPKRTPGEIVDLLQPGLRTLDAALDTLLPVEPRRQADLLAQSLTAVGAPSPLIARVSRLFEMNGAAGIAALGRQLGVNEIALTKAYTKLGEALGLDWAHSAAVRLAPQDPWDRLLAASLARDFEQLRLDFLARGRKADPSAAVDTWLQAQAPRVEQFRRLVQRARNASTTRIAMLAQIAAQARVLLAR